MALTYTAIAETLVGAGGASNITFSNIPQTYTHLVIMLSGRGSSGVVADSELRFNNSSSNNGAILWELNGTATPYGQNLSNLKLIDNGPSSTSGQFSNNYILIPNYTSSSRFKQMMTQNITENASNSAWMTYVAGRWSDTSAITSIVLVPGGGTYVQHSRATLYGLKTTV